MNIIHLPPCIKDKLCTGLYRTVEYNFTSCRGQSLNNSKSYAIISWSQSVHYLEVPLYSQIQLVHSKHVQPDTKIKYNLYSVQ